MSYRDFYLIFLSVAMLLFLFFTYICFEYSDRKIKDYGCRIEKLEKYQNETKYYYIHSDSLFNTGDYYVRVNPNGEIELKPIYIGR